GDENFCGMIAFAKTTGQTSTLLSETADYLLWYARNRSLAYFTPLFEPRKPIENPNERYVCVETAAGEIHDLSLKQKLGLEPIPSGRFLRLADTTSQTGSEQSRLPFYFQGSSFVPQSARGWSTNMEIGRASCRGRV